MAGQLNSIFAAINTAITANLVAAGIAPSYGMSGSARFQEAVPPRIVWVPTDEDIGAPRGMGGDEVVDSIGNQTITGLPPILTRTVTVECDVWGIDRDTVDLTMIDAVYSAVHDICSAGSYGVDRARWLLPEEAQKDGEVYRVWFKFFVPVTRVAPTVTTATITSLPITPQVIPILGS